MNLKIIFYKVRSAKGTRSAAQGVESLSWCSLGVWTVQLIKTHQAKTLKFK